MRWEEQFSFRSFYFLFIFYSTISFAKSTLLPQCTMFEAVALPINTLLSSQLQLNYIHTMQSHDSDASSSSSFSSQHPAHTSVCVPISNILLDSNCVHTQTHTHTLHCCLCVSELDLSPVYPCLCSSCLFSVQACECQAVRRWRAPLSRPALLHPLPAPLPALPVVTLGCLPTWQLQRTTGEERYDGVNWI